jgi:hypothetical protein
MNLSQMIQEAHSAVQKADIPSQLQSVAFAETLRFVLNEKYQPESSSKGREVVRPSDKGASKGMTTLAVKMGVDESSLADVYAIDGDEVTLHVASSKIDSVKPKATREVAILITAARQGSGADEGWTAASYVREALQQYGRFDSGNFATYLRKNGDVFNFRGKGAAIEIRLTRPGWETATELIRALV